MLITSLGLTLVGFALLVAAVATGSIAWAWACIAVGVFGLVLLLVDVLSGRRSQHSDEPDANQTAAMPAQSTDVNTSG